MVERKDRVLVVDDELALLKSYKSILENAGFEVSISPDGCYLADQLKKRGKDYFDILFCDTDMDFVDGPVGVRNALEKGLLDDQRTLIVGMSGDDNNQEYWREIAHFGYFYNKNSLGSEKIAAIARQGLRNFRTGGIWKSKMPKFNW